MFYHSLSEGQYFLKAYDQIVIKGPYKGVTKGLRIVTVNPANYPSAELKWYVSQLQAGQELTWLRKSMQPKLRALLNADTRLLHYVDVETFHSSIRNMRRRQRLSEQDVQNQVLDEFLDSFNSQNEYSIQLINPLWHLKRIELFHEGGYKCEQCERYATIDFIIGIAPNEWQSVSYDLSSFLTPARAYNYQQIIRAIEIYKSFKLPLINLNWNRMGDSYDGEPVILQLHHQYYVSGKLAWEYNDDCFQVLCRDCHASLHETQTIPVYDSEEDFENGKISETCYVESCSRCVGEGYITKYSHVMNGICFKCWGDGYMLEE